MNRSEELRCPQCGGKDFTEPVENIMDYSGNDSNGYTDHIICEDCNCEFVAEYKITLLNTRIIRKEQV